MSNNDVRVARAINITVNLFIIVAVAAGFMLIDSPQGAASTLAIALTSALMIAVSSFTRSEAAVWVSAVASIFIFLGGVMYYYFTFMPLLEALLMLLLVYIACGIVIYMLSKIIP